MTRDSGVARSPARDRRSRRPRSVRRYAAVTCSTHMAPIAIIPLSWPPGFVAERAVMSAALRGLLATLHLEQRDVNLFRGRSPQTGRQRVYGGQVIGQALVAACRTVDVAGRPPHSLHAYFLLGGDPKVPIVYDVDRIRDGKSFTTRRVVAIQHGEAIFTMAVSFHRAEPGLSHQAKMPAVPGPE